MLANLTDAHCHFTAQLPDNLPPHGVELCAVTACFANEWSVLARTARASVKKAFGLHPDFEMSKFDDAFKIESEIFSTFLPKLESYLVSAAALGEIGLDSRIVDRVPLEMQKRIFAAQLEMAYKNSLPTIIHCVGEWGAVYDTMRRRREVILNSEGEAFDQSAQKNKFLIHAASCSAELAVQFEKIGAYFSFGLRELTLKRGIECVKRVSEDRILIESDGECTADILEETASALAEIRSLTPARFAEITFENFNSFYAK